MCVSNVNRAGKHFEKELKIEAVWNFLLHNGKQGGGVVQNR